MATTLTWADTLANQALAAAGESNIAITADNASTQWEPPAYTVNPFTGGTQQSLSGAGGAVSAAVDSLGLAGVSDANAVASGAKAAAAAAGGALPNLAKTLGQTLANLLGPIWWVIALVAVVAIAVLFLK